MRTVANVKLTNNQEGVSKNIKINKLILKKQSKIHMRHRPYCTDFKKVKQELEEEKFAKDGPFI